MFYIIEITLHVIVLLQVFFREGTNRLCLEGESWHEIENTDEDLNIVQLSVGSSGDVWGVTRDGKAIYRNGVDYCYPSGKVERSVDLDLRF